MESPGIENSKGNQSWPQTELIPRCQWDNYNKYSSWRQKELIPRRKINQRGIPDKEYPGFIIPKGDSRWRQKKKSKVPAGKFLCRDNLYVVYNFYVYPSWRQKEIISKCQRENFVTAGNFFM